MRANKTRILEGIGAVLLLAALAACGSGLDSGASNSSSSSGGSNSTPPGIPNSIVFIPPASTNTVIALQGTGGKTNASVTFQVNDASNTGVEGIPVTFTLIPTTGDATLTTATGTTAANGQVSTDVVSGNEHGSVTVHAVVSTPSGIKTADSNSLTISTGIPTERNFAMASTNLTAGNADDTLGITDVITVQLSDRFNNPAPDGTAVAFTANSGQIPGQCQTAGGSCTVTWTSSGLPATNNVPLSSAGRVEILAYTVGEESFDDVDGDGVFDNNDVFLTFASTAGAKDTFTESNNSPAADDIGEIYLDGQETGSYDNAHLLKEPYIDFNKNGQRDAPDGLYYGFGCKGTAKVSCAGTATKEIGKQICVELSTSGAIITPSTLGPITVSGSPASGVNVTFTVSDENLQALASKTTVTLKSTITNGTVNSPTNLPFTYQDSGCGGNVQSFTVNIVQTPAVAPALPLPVSGTLQLVVVTPTPGGAETDSPVIVLQ